MKKILSILLCMAMLFSTTACGAKTTPEAAPPEEATPTEIESPEAEEIPEPEIIPEDIYREAVTALGQLDAMTLDIAVTQEMAVGTETFVEKTQETIVLQGIGSSEFSASRDSETTWGEGYSVSQREIFADGTVYADIGNAKVSAAFTAEEYTDRLIPAVLLNADLYKAIELGASGELLFSDTTTAENWLTSEEATLLSASGSACLDESGMLKDSTYTASYRFGAAEYSVTVICAIDVDAAEVTLPTDISAYAETEHLDALVSMERAYGYLLDSDSISCSVNDTYITQAGGLQRTEQVEMHTYGSGNDLLAQIQTDIGLTFSTGETENARFTESFKDGVYTMAEDDGEPVPDPTVPSYLLQNNCDVTVGALLQPLDCIQNLTVKDLGSYYLMEYTLAEELAENYKAALCAMIYEDEAYLDNLATNYRTITATGYLALDKYTGLPTSANPTYVGSHTIEGAEFLLSMESLQSFTIASTSTYAKLTGEHLVTGKPETDPTPLFYHVTGENGQEMWLLGTIHIGDERTTRLPDEIYNAFDAADSLAVEFDTNAFMAQLENDPELAAQVASYYFYLDGTTAKDHIQDEEIYAKALDLLKASGNYQSTMLLMKPSLWSDIIDMANVQLGHKLTSDFGVDSQLLERAEAAEKNILNVESGISQIKMLTDYSDELQELLLYMSMSKTAQETNAETEELFELWCSGDEAALIAMIREDDIAELTEEELALYEEYENSLLTERDTEMLQVAQGYLESGETVFYAVGLAHLLSESGLVDALRNAGYTVELVSYN